MIKITTTYFLFINNFMKLHVNCDIVNGIINHSNFHTMTIQKLSMHS